MQLTHKVELCPTPEQVDYFVRACGTARMVWNWALDEWNKQRAAGRKPVTMALKKQLGICHQRDPTRMNMLFLLIVLVIVVVAVLAVVKAKSQGGIGDEVWPFYPKKPLSQPEQVLYFRLVQALPDHIVLAQVQLSRILGVKKGNNYQAWFNRINRMSADFVVCNKDSSIVAVIELDDATHQKEDRQAADAKKDKALSSAGIRIIRWQAKAIPDVGAIQATFMPNIAVKRDAPQAARP